MIFQEKKTPQDTQRNRLANTGGLTHGNSRETYGLYFSLNENPHGVILAFLSRLKLHTKSVSYPLMREAYSF